MVTADAKERLREKQNAYHRERKDLESKCKEVQEHAALQICEKVAPGQNEFDCASHVIRCKCSAREKKNGGCGNIINSPLQEIISSLLPMTEPHNIRTREMVDRKLQDARCFGNNPTRKQRLDEAVKGVRTVCMCVCVCVCV